MHKPNFLIIGAMKAGTTIVYDALEQHPEIYVSKVKEPHFFSQGKEAEAMVSLEGDTCYTTDYATYLQLFTDVQQQKAIGEASTSYLHVPGTAQRIQHRLPDVKLICILRNPVARAYSHYLYLFRQGVEPLADFAAALAREEERIADHAGFGWYTRIGLYSQHLQAYFAHFPQTRIRVYLFDDLIANQEAFYVDLYRYLNVSDTFRPDTSITRNPSGIPKNWWLNNLISKPNPVRDFLQPRLPRVLYRLGTSIRDRNLSKPTMPAEVRQALIAYYRPEIDRLQHLLNRNLASWLE